MTRTLALTSFVLIATLAACGGSNHTSADGSTDTDGGMSSALCSGTTGTCAAVATSIFNSDFTGMGTLDSVNLGTDKATLNLDATLDADNALRLQNGILYELQRDSGAVRLYNPITFKVMHELPTGDTAIPSGGTLPEGFFIDPTGKIWVTLSGNKAAYALGIVDPVQPGMITYIALPQDPSDTDGKPEPYSIYSCNGTLWITLQSYYFDSSNVIHYAAGRIVPVNMSTKVVGTAITLLGQNPSDIRAVGSDCTDVIVANSSSTTTSPDGTGDIERVNLTAGTTKLLANDTTLGGRPVFAVTNGNNVFVAEYFDPEPNGMGVDFLSSVKLVAYDLTKNTVGSDLTGKFGNINFLELQDGKLYFGAGVFSTVEASGKLPRGLYIMPADGTALTATPIDLQMTPSAIALP